MLNIETFLFNVSMVIATLWIVEHFWKGFFDKKKRNFLNIGIWCIYFFLQIFIEYNRGNGHISLIGLNILFIYLIGVSGYVGAGKTKLFLLLLFYALWGLIEVFVFQTMRLIPAEQDYLNLIGAMISRIGMIIFVYILPAIWNKKMELYIPNRYSVILLLIPVGSIWIAINEFFAGGTMVFSVTTISIVLLFNIVIFEIYTKVNEAFMYDKERIVFLKQLEAISQNTVAQKKLMDDFHKEKHDLINKLIVIRGNIESEDKETTLANLNQIINSDEVTEAVSNTGNITIDSIINFKYAVAKQYGIQFKLNIFVPETLPVDQCELGVVIGNALDNAIEAARECEAKEVEIFMGVRKKAWIMVVKNPYAGVLKMDRKGNFLSTKKEKERHGFGINSIRKIAEKYQGSVNIETENNIFKLTVLLQIG